ncbi:hypothetical protein [Trichormus variabilis]|uniref:Peptidase n=1 Tax=Trichormus variabilis SAG 1403-4b TaxID=447716 RepID=A0A3S1BZA6_ANAVA|nr:hypothetical protein [Trichormus variabilis]MBD2628482.1 hypothetical protein [Trichormus variabilis FACHB-164]RUS92514.1 hypothetical protein DSM107003_49970 [Trichormus variabilis SAG 1403-4b]
MEKYLEIFKAGKHTAMDGRTLSFGESEINASVKAYDPSIHEAPLVVGHPKSDAPAYGWVKGLTGNTGLMQAIPHQVDPVFAEMVNAGRFKKISASFYMPDHPTNPVPGVYYLKHVGFLGAVAPAVKGLKSASFEESEEGILDLEVDFAECAADFLEFCECDKGGKLDVEQLKQENERLKATLKRQESTSFVESVKSKILPSYRTGLVEFVSSLDSSQELEFSEGDEQKKLPAADWFKDFLAHLPNVVELGEVAGDEKKLPETPTDPKKIAKLATQYVEDQAQKGTQVSYSEAVAHVMEVQ